MQGLNKQETAERFGKEQVHKWRRSYYVRPPNGESLEMCLARAVSYFKEQVNMPRKYLRLEFGTFTSSLKQFKALKIVPGMH